MVILLMLGASPLSVTYTFADIKYDNQGSKMTKNDEFESILTEQVVNGDRQVQRFGLPDNAAKEEI